MVSAVNGPGLAAQTKLVAAAKEAGTIKQFMPSEFSAFGAVGEFRSIQAAASTACFLQDRQPHRQSICDLFNMQCTAGIHQEKKKEKRGRACMNFHDLRPSVLSVLPAELSWHACAGEASAPLLYGPKAQVRAALEAAGIPHTYIVSYGFASYWANGLGELGQKNRVPPSPSSSNRVPFYGTGRTKCALSPP